MRKVGKEDPAAYDLVPQLFQQELTRRAVLGRALGLVGVGVALTPLATLIQACNSATTTTTQKQVTIAMPSTPSGWDIDQDFGPGIEEVMSAVNDRLVGWKFIPGTGGGLVANVGATDIQSQLTPALAESWTIAGNKVTFKLRQGVMSHAGNELTSADVHWTFERAFGLKAVGAVFNGLAGLDSLDSVQVINKYTVSIQLSQPPDLFFMTEAIDHRSIYDSTEMKKHGTANDPYAATWGHTGDAGFGRYKITSNEPGNQVVLDAFDKHYLGSPLVKHIVIKEVPTSSDRVALLSRGSVAMVTQMLPEELASLQQNSGVQVWSFPQPYMASILIDATYPPFDKLEVREALAYAMPYQDIITGIFKGFATRAGGYVLSNFPVAQTYFKDKFNTDPAKAKSLLAQAGVGPFNTTFGYDSSQPLQQQIAVLYQSKLADIGITARLNAMTHADYTQSLFTPKHSAKLPLMGYIDGPYISHPYYGLYQNWRSQSTLNLDEANIPGMDALIEKIRTASYSDALPLSIQTQKLIADYVPWIFICEPGLHVATRKDLIKNVAEEVAYIDYWQLS